jgi:hypothetical protein
MRYVLIVTLALCALAAQALPPQTTPKRKIPYKTPEIAASCYWTHGRLGVYNGNPSFRVWRTGTTKIVWESIAAPMLSAATQRTANTLSSRQMSSD